MDELSVEIENVKTVLQARRSHPSKLFVEITAKCNLKCGMCVKQSGNGDAEGDMSRETFNCLKEAFPYLDTLILNGIGEPLLHPHLEEFIYTAKKLMPEGSLIGFQTNGILLNDRRASSVVAAGLNRICLSVDAFSEDIFRKIRKGGKVEDMDRAFSALNRAKSTIGRPDLQIGIEFVLMRDNLYELPETLRWAAGQGVTFAIVTQLLPYDKAMACRAVYDTNTAEAVAVYEKWKTKAENKGIAIKRYLDIFIFMKFIKNSAENWRIFDIIEQMKADASSRSIALNMERLFLRDEEWFRRVEQVFSEAQRIADKEGIDIIFPELAPKNNRRCEFVEAGGTFVSWDGNLHPCYFLWHRYHCFVGGWEKKVKPWVFGNLSEKGILETWNDSNYRSFREGVLRYDFPFCFDCSFALCDYVQAEDFEQDCYISSVPCGACLWCTGLFHCLQ